MFQKLGLLYKREAQEYSVRVDKKFCIQDGVLNRQQGPETKMVVPQKFRDLVLHLGHSVPWVGHLGRQKTTARISPHFFWHNLRRDVDEFFRS